MAVIISINSTAGSGCDTCMPPELDCIGGRDVAPFRVFLRRREVDQKYEAILLQRQHTLYLPKHPAYTLRQTPNYSVRAGFTQTWGNVRGFEVFVYICEGPFVDDRSAL